jgi:predicted ArsR family transcriptional regulator
MTDTRRAVLEQIRVSGQAAVQHLAEALGISPISVRHHLTALQAEGLVKVELDRQGVGRPRHVYSLSERALQYFPAPYQTLVERLLDELKASLPADQVDAIIGRMAANVAAHYGSVKGGGTLQERTEYLLTVLGAEGFLAEIQQVGDNLVLTALNCPYTTIGQRHPEVCQIDSTLIQSVLGVDVEQKSCVLHGDRSCVFSVQG